ncbi:Protein SPA1-RELATED 3 [Acorus calamus]|uniref:Protein SPA1-RELATED 3 n=1 Tax=Acorus calamus TaxID=4465 RepID=A0AAV9FKW8_ACOCL|nr:Protein SPA1-RELATED 3 [Acorus calamus]
MGGVEDDEPPSKRLKASSGDLGSLANNSSIVEPVLNGLCDRMAKPLTTQGSKELIGPKGSIKKVEFVRIITKALYTLGYEKSGALLEQESGINLHSSEVNLFRDQILGGKWDESVATLRKIGMPNEYALKSATFLILEQKFFELLEKNRVMDALSTLRHEITPVCVDAKRLRELSRYIVCSSQYGNIGFSSKDMVGQNRYLNLLEEVQKLLPPTIMIPERRLEHLVEQALSVQRRECVFHNSLDGSLSLYSDHQCGKDQIPSHTLQVLQAHSDEVWFLKFSNNGKYLASASNDKTAIIWEVSESREVSLKHRLIGHERSILTVAWSPDDSQLLTCGVEEALRRWDVNTGACLQIYTKAGLGIISCGWFPDGKCILFGLSDKSITMWDLEGKEVECWKGQRTLRISDMAVTNNGKWIMSMCRESAILLLDREASVERLIEEDNTITSFTLSKDSKFLLVNLVNQEIHLWSIVGDPKVVCKYKGHMRTRFVIRSCFGGYEQSFIASGSEDSQVYLWHRETGELIETLSGHSGAVNSVSWNPVDPHMLASASDDRTIRIWGLNPVTLKPKDVCANGVIHCNGNSQ